MSSLDKMMPRVILYWLAFGHHGRYTAYSRLVHVLPECGSINATLPLERHLPRGVHRRLLEPWWRLNEYRLWPYLQRRERQLVHFLYPENQMHRSWRWKGEHFFVLSCHQPSRHLEGMRARPKFAGFFQGLQVADAVVTLSASVADAYVRLAPQAKVVTIPHGVDVDFFQPPLESVPQKRVLTVGTWLRDYELWRQVVELLARAQPDVVFDVIANANVLEGLQECAAEFPGRINLLTGLSDRELRNRYRMAQVLFLPLREAVANNALLEGTACGLPVVVTDLPAVREYTSAEAALYVSERDPEVYAGALGRVLNDSACRATMSRAARASARRFDWRVIAQRFHDLYRSFGV